MSQNFRVKDLTSGFRAVKAEIAHSLLYLLPNYIFLPYNNDSWSFKKWKEASKYLANRSTEKDKKEKAISVFFVTV